MDWSAEDMDRLYDLYQRHIDQLREDVVKTNRLLGAERPSTRLERLTRPEFDLLLKNWRQDPESARLWLRRIIRGHEKEFPRLDVA